VRPRVFIAGRGAVSALGEGREALLGGIFAGRSGLRPLARLAGVACSTSVAGEVPLPSDEEGHALAMAARAALEALSEAGWDPDERRGAALVLSTTKADLSGIECEGDGLGNPGRLARRLADALGVGGPVAAVSCACASGLSAIALAARRIRSGRAERVLVVGVDALSAFVLRGFTALLALDPGPCRPFDRARRGLSLGEGAGALALTSREEGSIGVEVLGAGESNDANHVTGPSRDGEGLLTAARRALAEAGIAPADVGYVHLHGTGTSFNDATEGKALARLFGGPTPPASGTKAQTGHTLGAAGLLESLVAVEALLRGTAPGNVGLEETDVDPSLTLARAATPLEGARAALKISAGFGGINAAVVFALTANEARLESVTASPPLTLSGARPQAARSRRAHAASPLGIAAAGVADAAGIAGTRLGARAWADLGVDAGAPLWPTAFPAPFRSYRRLDLLSRFVCLAVEAAGLDAALDEEARAGTALVLGTTLGCLEADLAFARSLAPGAEIDAALFPYTLPSTCLGELAIRHRLRGPCLCLGVAPGGLREALREAQELLEDPKCPGALVCVGDALAGPGEAFLRVGAVAPPSAGAVIAALLLVRGPSAPGLPSVDDLLTTDRLVERIAFSLREIHAPPRAAPGDAGP